MKIKAITFIAAIAFTLCMVGLFPNQVYAAQRGRPHLNEDRTTFVGDNEQPLRGPFTSTEWTPAVPYDQIEKIKNLGFNAVHLYAESFDPNYPNPGSTAPGYAAAEVDKIVQATRDLGLYLVITIGNGANNGNYNGQWTKDFWSFYAKRYANETHVLFEIQNEPVAWGPPYSVSWATPKGALDMEVATYKIIRKYAPDTPVLLFSYSVPWGESGATDALKDIHAFNSEVFGNENAVWTNEAVAFHGYSGSALTSEFAASLLKSGYPCFMTEFAGSSWGSRVGGLDPELTSELERLGISWLTFQYIPPTGVAEDVTEPEHYAAVVENYGLSWKPDYGSWPEVQGAYGNDGLPRKTAEDWVNYILTGTTHIEAEDFDGGGEGISYHDSSSSNLGGEYRDNEAVDIQTTSDTGNGYNVCWTLKGEWLEYTISVQHPGYYDLSLRVANNSSGSVQISSRNQDKTGTWVLPRTGGLQTWKTDTRQVYLEYGRQVLRINIVSDGFNLNWIELSPVKAGPVADGTYKFINRDNALAMTKGTVSDSITVSEYTDSKYQQWKIRHTGGGQYTITSVGNMWSMKNVIILPVGNGYYRMIQGENGLDMLTTLSSGSLIVDKGAYTGEATQQWGILSTSDTAFPAGLSATFNSSGQGAELTWNAMAGADSYNIKRSEDKGGPYTDIATGITETSFTDTDVTSDAKYYYVVSAVTGGKESLYSAEAVPRFPKLTGSIMGTEGSWNNSGDTITKVFDNDLNTFFDAPTGNGCWVGLDFGSGMSSVVKQINFCPRKDFPNRMVGGIFQGANKADFSDAVTLYTITAQPAAGIFTSVDLTNTTAFRYIRFLSPDDGFGNVAELEFYGYTSTNTYLRLEAENYTTQSGIQTESCSEGGQDVSNIENGDYLVFNDIDFGKGAVNFQARVASASDGGNIEIRLDSITGPLVGTCPVTGTGGWQDWTVVQSSVSGLSDVHNLYLVFTGGNGSLFNLNWLSFSGESNSGKLGDINSDGKKDSTDFLLMKKHLLGMEKIKKTKMADLNADGTIDALDFALMKRYMLGMSTEFTAATPTPKFHCFLLLGQSNMAGYALSQDSDRVEDPRVLVLGYDNNQALGRVTDQWDVACPPLHASWLDAIGPGDWFGKTMIQKVPASDTIGLIPCAISGERIETFLKGEGTKYDWIIQRAQLAQQKGGIIEGIIFHQGESNNGDPNWPGKVKKLVEDLRTDLNLGDVPFIAGELLYTGGCAGHNKLVNQLPDLITNCYVASASDLVVDPTDTQYNLHFSHDSAVTLGKRYAEIMIQALGW